MNTKCGHTCSLEKLFQESPPSSPLPLNIYLIGTVLDTENMEKAILTFLYYDSNVKVEISLMQLYSAIGPKNWIFSNAAHEKVDARVLLRAFATSRESTGGCYFASRGKGAEESGEVSTCQRSRVMFLSCLR